MAYQSSIKLTKVVERFELEVLNAGKNYDHCLVRADDINRPALQILGFFDYFAPDRIQARCPWKEAKFCAAFFGNLKNKACFFRRILVSY